MHRLDKEAESLLCTNNDAQDVVGALGIAEQTEATTLLRWGTESVRVRRSREGSPAICSVANVPQSWTGMGNVEIEHARYRAVVHHAVVRREIAVTHHLNRVLRQQQPVDIWAGLETLGRLVKSSKQLRRARQCVICSKGIGQRIVRGLALEIRQGLRVSDEVSVDHFGAIQESVGADVTKESMNRRGVWAKRPNHVGSDTPYGVHSSHEHVAPTVIHDAC
jgi:hypothetical protein